MLTGKTPTYVEFLFMFLCGLHFDHFTKALLMRGVGADVGYSCFIENKLFLKNQNLLWELSMIIINN